ncbi:MAG: putative N-acetyltransferase YsnE [Burkholderia plantarii]|nr:MAG: putative N-acetyltransferase YsnE [Burkholderia plantarii]
MSHVFDILDTTPHDPIATALLDGLAVEYSSRYGDLRPGVRESVRKELGEYPAEHFAAPAGAFLLLLDDGEPVGGGAFQRYDEKTAELKRIWTHVERRRQGIARQVLAALEERARRQGYQRLYLTTGFRQPEAAGLYEAAGYAPLFDRAIAVEVHWRLPFGKDLIAPGRLDTLADLRPNGPLGRR